MILIYKKIKSGRSVYLCSCDGCLGFFKRRSDYKDFKYCTSCSNKERGIRRITHGDNNTNSRLHVSWSNMKRRCINPTDKEIISYRDKGISICSDWLNYSLFKEWAMDNGYNDKLTIDRVDNTKGYSPDNCRFANYSTQNANKGITNKNKSGFIGVSKSGSRFRSYIDWEYKRVELGLYDTAIEASVVRDSYVIENNLPHTLNNKTVSSEL
tara:strand:- start:2614 stop:3246 length:633 start_codon:yes stop_codon:yes gene_type:complete